MPPSTATARRISPRCWEVSRLRPPRRFYPAPPSAPLTQTAEPPAANSPMDISLASSGRWPTARSSFLTDHRNPTANNLSLDDIHIGLQNFSTIAQTPAPFDMGLKIGSGGTITAKGALDFAQSQATTALAIDEVDFAEPAGIMRNRPLRAISRAENSLCMRIF